MIHEGNAIQRLDRSGIIRHDYRRVRSRVWTCSTCDIAVMSPEPISAPPQCRRCGGIAFETVRAEPQ
jgi:hypothetical protein